MFTRLKSEIKNWYNKHIAAHWWASASMWMGVIAATLPLILDGGQAILDNINLLGGALAWSPTTVIRVQLVMAVLIPPLRAWRQKNVEQAALYQAAKDGKVRVLR